MEKRNFSGRDSAPRCPRRVQRRNGSPPDASARRPYLNSSRKWKMGRMHFWPTETIHKNFYRISMNCDFGMAETGLTGRLSIFVENRLKCLCMKHLRIKLAFSNQAQSSLIKVNQGIFMSPNPKTGASSRHSPFSFLHSADGRVAMRVPRDAGRKIRRD